MTHGGGNVQPRLHKVLAQGGRILVAAGIGSDFRKRVLLGLLPLRLAYALMRLSLVLISDRVTFLPDLVYGERAF